MIHIHNGVEERYDNEDYVAALFAPNSNTVPSSSTQEHDQQLEEEEEEYSPPSTSNPPPQRYHTTRGASSSSSAPLLGPLAESGWRKDGKNNGKKGMSLDSKSGRWLFTKTGKPVGRAPNGTRWDGKIQDWVNMSNGEVWSDPKKKVLEGMGGGEGKRRFKRPPGRGKKGMKWDYENGGWVEDEEWREDKGRKKSYYKRRKVKEEEGGEEDDYWGDLWTFGGEGRELVRSPEGTAGEDEGELDLFRPSNKRIKRDGTGKRTRKKGYGDTPTFFEGQYARPKGRAPKDCTWDSTQGCWIRSDGTPLFVGEKEEGGRNLKAEIRHRGWENKERKLVKGEGEYGEEVRPMRIIVVGAGIAGISAARELLSRGHSVLVLEGRKRVGGRLNTAHLTHPPSNPIPLKPTKAQPKARNLPHISTTFKSCKLPDHETTAVDMGGMFIHGIDSNPIFSLALRTGIKSKAMGTTKIYDVAGGEVEKGIDWKAEDVWNGVLERAHLEGRKEGFLETEGGENGGKKVGGDERVDGDEKGEGEKGGGDEKEEEDEGGMEVLWTKQLENITNPDEDEKKRREEKREGVDGDNTHAAKSASTITTTTTNTTTTITSTTAATTPSTSPSPLTTSSIHISKFLPNHITETESFQEIIDRVSSSEISALTEEEKRCFNWHKANLELSCGVDLSEIGREWNEDEVWGFEGDHHMLSEGFQPLVTNLATGINTRFEVEVQRIELDEDLRVPRTEVNSGGWGESLFQDLKKARVDLFGEDKKKTGGVKVVAKGGEVFEADMVLCTAPLGVLKTDMIEFRPKLRERKREAIQKVGFGVLNKCALAFSEKFWDDVDFIGHAAEKHNQTPVIFTNVNVLDGKPVLCAMFGGSFAAKVEGWKDEDVVKEVMKVLKLIYGEKTSEPVDTFVSRWRSDRYARGSFCFIPPGVSGVEHSELERPCFDRFGNIRCLFAGEHTSSTHPSTIHGAYMSGIREAYRLDLTYHGKGQGLTFDWSGNTIYKRTFGLGKTLGMIAVKDLEGAIRRPNGRAKINQHWDYIAGKWVDFPPQEFSDYYERVEGANRNNTKKGKVWNRDVGFLEDEHDFVGGGGILMGGEGGAGAVGPVEHSLFAGMLVMSPTESKVKVEEDERGDKDGGEVKGPSDETLAKNQPEKIDEERIKPLSPMVTKPEATLTEEGPKYIFTEQDDKAILRAAEIFEGDDFAKKAKDMMGSLSHLSAEDIEERCKSLFREMLALNNKVVMGRWG